MSRASDNSNNQESNSYDTYMIISYIYDSDLIVEKEKLIDILLARTNTSWPLEYATKINDIILIEHLKMLKFKCSNLAIYNAIKNNDEETTLGLLNYSPASDQLGPAASRSEILSQFLRQACVEDDSRAVCILFRLGAKFDSGADNEGYYKRYRDEVMREVNAKFELSNYLTKENICRFMFNRDTQFVDDYQASQTINYYGAADQLLRPQNDIEDDEYEESIYSGKDTDHDQEDFTGSEDIFDTDLNSGNDVQDHDYSSDHNCDEYNDHVSDLSSGNSVGNSSPKQRSKLILDKILNQASQNVRSQARLDEARHEEIQKAVAKANIKFRKYKHNKSSHNSSFDKEKQTLLCENEPRDSKSRESKLVFPVLNVNLMDYLLILKKSLKDEDQKKYNKITRIIGTGQSSAGYDKSDPTAIEVAAKLKDVFLVCALINEKYMPSLESIIKAAQTGHMLIAHYINIWYIENMTNIVPTTDMCIYNLKSLLRLCQNMSAGPETGKVCSTFERLIKKIQETEIL